TFSSTGRDAIYRFTSSGAEQIAAAPAISAPNGLVVDDQGIVVVGFADSVIVRIPAAGGAPVPIGTPPRGQLDGVVRLDDGSLLVSSWAGQAIYRIGSDGSASTVVENVESPADIGFDTRRHRLLIPIFSGHRIEVREVH